MTIDYTTCLKDGIRTNKIPRSKVVNIKLKENHYMPNSTTNNENQYSSVVVGNHNITNGLITCGNNTTTNADAKISKISLAGLSSSRNNFQMT